MDPRPNDTCFSHSSPDQVLDEVYPMVHRLIGDASFHLLSNQYCHEFVDYPTDPETFGDSFGQLLLQQYMQHPELDKLALLPELARLEWLLHDAAQYVDSSQIDMHALSALSEQQTTRVCFHASPSLRMMYSHWPLINIWQAFLSGSMAHISSEGGTEWLCIYRDPHNEEKQAIVEPLNDATAKVLGAILKGYSLAELTRLDVDLKVYLPLLVEKHWLDCFTLGEE